HRGGGREGGAPHPLDHPGEGGLRAAARGRAHALEDAPGAHRALALGSRGPGRAAHPPRPLAAPRRAGGRAHRELVARSPVGGFAMRRFTPVDVSSLILTVQKPSRYLGNEVNAVRKDLREAEVTWALAFPDLYEMG